MLKFSFVSSSLRILTSPAFMNSLTDLTSSFTLCFVSNSSLCLNHVASIRETNDANLISPSSFYSQECLALTRGFLPMLFQFFLDFNSFGKGMACYDGDGVFLFVDFYYDEPNSDVQSILRKILDYQGIFFLL